MSIILFTKENCPACKNLKNIFEAKKIDFQEIEATEPGVLTILKALGVVKVPVVYNADKNEWHKLITNDEISALVNNLIKTCKQCGR